MRNIPLLLGLRTLSYLGLNMLTQTSTHKISLFGWALGREVREKRKGMFAKERRKERNIQTSLTFLSSQSLGSRCL